MVLLVELYCEVKLQIVFLCSCLCEEKLIKNTIIETYCLRICCQGTSKRAVHAEGGAVSINTKIKSEDTEITDSRNCRHVITTLILRVGSNCHRGGSLKILFLGLISVR